MSRWSFYLEKRGWDRDKLFIVSRDEARGSLSQVVTSFVTTTVAEGAEISTPTLSSSYEEQRDGLGDVDNFLQAALDCAWEAGLRPKGFADHANELTATRYHLEDMRALALKTPVQERKP